MDFAGIPCGADVCRTSGSLDASTAPLGDAAAGVEALTRLDRLSDFRVVTGKSHNDTCATVVVFAFFFALCGIDGTSLVAFVFALAGCPVGFSALDCTVVFASTGRGTEASGALAVLPVIFCLDGFSLVVILAEGFVARTFGLCTFASATGAAGAGSFGALPTRAPADAGADTASSSVGGVTRALGVRPLRGFRVWPSGFASTLTTAGAANFAAGGR